MVQQTIPIPVSDQQVLEVAKELQREGVSMLERGRRKFCEKNLKKAGNKVRAATVFANACLEEAVVTYWQIGGIALVEQMVNARIAALKGDNAKVAETQEA